MPVCSLKELNSEVVGLVDRTKGPVGDLTESLATLGGLIVLEEYIPDLFDVILDLLRVKMSVSRDSINHELLAAHLVLEPVSEGDGVVLACGFTVMKGSRDVGSQLRSIHDRLFVMTSHGIRKQIHEVAIDRCGIHDAVLDVLEAVEVDKLCPFF